MGNLAQNLTNSAMRVGNRTAIKLDETEVPFRALDAAAAASPSYFATGG